MGRSHARAAKKGVGAVGGRRAGVNIHPGGCEMDRSGPIIGKRGQTPTPANGSHRLDVIEPVGCWIRRTDIVIGSGISRRSDKEGPAAPRIPNGIFQRDTRTTSAPTVAENTHILGHGILDAFHGVGRCTGAIGTEEFQCHQTHLPCHADMVPASVGLRANRAGTMRPVVVVIHRIATPVDHVDPEDIVRIAVAIVVDAIAGDLTCIPPHLALKVLVGIADARIDDRHGHVGGTGGDVPCPHRVDILPSGSSRLAGIPESPEEIPAKCAVARHGLRGHHVIGLDVFELPGSL